MDLQRICQDAEMFENDDFESGSEWEPSEKMALKAYDLYEQGRMCEALEQLDLAIEANPENTSLYFNKALAFDALERFDEAIECYNAALEARPDDPEIYNSLAVDYTRTGLYDLAITTFATAIEIDPAFEPAYCNQIITYAEMGNFDKAEEVFYLAQQINPDCPLCFYNIGNAMFCQGEMKRAIWCWKKTQSLEPEHPQINYRIAQAYWGLGEKDNANEYFLRHLRQDAGDMDVLFDYALFLLQSGNIASATEKFNRILELDPDFALAHHYLGEIHLNAGNISLAIPMFEKAMKIDDNFAGPGFRLGQCYLKQGKTAEAAEILKEEMRHTIEDIDVLVSMGTMFLELKEYDFASNCFLKATDLEPKNYLPFYYIGFSMYSSGEAADALHFFSYAIDLNGKHIESLKMLAVCHASLTHFSQAIGYLDEILAVEPANAEVVKLRKQIRLNEVKCQIRSFCSDVVYRAKHLFGR
jgi:tetratricopeptide (TPR) repeat protein